MVTYPAMLDVPRELILWGDSGFDLGLRVASDVVIAMRHCGIR